ncbi:type II toxin-antitoxin system YafO family toxin [Pseudomonas syringae]|uniref:Type II toxin-antitoxin system YafO family toxin n=1 Tax=Pseudomonas syringae CC1417 TaxID=1357272 RepID=A0AAU8LE76_PSESX
MSEIEVSFHPDLYNALIEDVLKDFPDFAEALLEDFREYKSGGLPDYFGKDDLYLHPPLAYSVKLWHIHLAMPPEKFPRGMAQRDRKCRKGNPHQDAALVYVQGLYEENRYCILTVLHPDAHSKARENQVIGYLARLAKEFRDAN